MTTIGSAHAIGVDDPKRPAIDVTQIEREYRSELVEQADADIASIQRELDEMQPLAKRERRLGWVDKVGIVGIAAGAGALLAGGPSGGRRALGGVVGAAAGVGVAAFFEHLQAKKDADPADSPPRYGPGDQQER